MTTEAPERADLRVRYRLLSPRGRAPTRATSGSSGWDLYAPTGGVVSRGAILQMPLEIAVEIPAGWEGQIRLRSGLARLGLVMPNGPGTIDSDYRGPLSILLGALGDLSSYRIAPGDRIAQLVFCRVPIAVEWVEIDELTETARGAGGFGSTGR